MNKYIILKSKTRNKHHKKLDNNHSKSVRDIIVCNAKLESLCIYKTTIKKQHK